MSFPSRPISRVADVVLGKMLQSQSGPGGIQLPYLRAAHVQPGGQLIDLGDEQRMYFSPKEAAVLDLRAGDVVIVEGGAGYGRSAVLEADLPGWGFQNSIIRVRPRPEQADARFLSYALRSAQDRGEVDLVVNTATIPHFTAEKVSRFGLPMPTASEQRRIADYLDRETVTIDALIEKQRSLVDGFRERRGAAVEHAIYGANAEMQRLGRCMVTRSGEVPTIDDGGDIPVYGAGRLLGWAQWSNAQPGELVVGRVGSVGSLRLLGSDAWVSDNAIVCRWDDTRVDPRYGYYAMSLVDMSELASGTAMPLLTASRLKKQSVPVPPLDEQRAIADRLDRETAKIDALIAKAERFIELAQERRAALITAAVTGQLEIPAEETAA